MHANGKPYNKVRTTIVLCVLSLVFIAAILVTLLIYKSRFYTINYHLNVPTSAVVSTNLDELGFEKARLVSYVTSDGYSDGVLPASYVSVSCLSDEVYVHPGKQLGVLGDSGRTIVAWSYRPDGGGRRLYSGIRFKNLFESGQKTIDLYAVWATKGIAAAGKTDKFEPPVVTASGEEYEYEVDEEGEIILPKITTYENYEIVYHLAEDDDSFYAGVKGNVEKQKNLNPGAIYRFKANAYREGYSLVAWVDADGNEYKPGNRFCDMAKNNETVDLYAKWSRAEYTITYMVEDDEKSNNAETYSSPRKGEDGIISFNPAEKDGYYFTGWYTNENLSKRVGDVIGYEGEVKEVAVNGTDDKEVTMQTVDTLDTDYIFSDLVLYPGFKHKLLTLTFNLEDDLATWSDNPNAKKKRSDQVFFGDDFYIYGDKDVQRFDNLVLVGWSFEKQEIPEGFDSEEVEEEEIDTLLMPEFDFAAGNKITLEDIEKKLNREINHKEEIVLYPVWMENLDPAEKDSYILSCTANKIGNSVLETDNKLYISIEASTPTIVNSIDDKFYLVAINQVSNEIEYIVDCVSKDEAVRSGTYGKVSGTPSSQGIARFELLLGNDITAGQPYHRYTIDLRESDGRDIEGPNDGTHITAAMLDYALAVKTSTDAENEMENYSIISNTEYVSSPESIAHGHYYNAGRSKKGIQGLEHVYDTTSGVYENPDYADVSHVFINLYASNIIVKEPVDCSVYGYDPLKAVEDGYNYEYNGKFYAFQGGASGIAQMLNEKNISLTVQVMLDYSEMTEKMINSKARNKGHELYSWENSSKESREWIEAMFCWLSENMSGITNAKSYASNWILGNEVNSYNTYQYSGSMSRGEFFKSYTETYRSYYNAIKSYNSEAKVYICADQCWNTADNGYAAKDLLDTCANLFMDMEKGTMDWNIAYHPYSYPLISRALWENTNIQNDVDTTYITMYNLDVLTDYIKRNYYHVGSDGELKTPKVIISELGWTYKNNAQNQAASLVYGYYISACNDLVVAYEPRSMYDAPQEAANGLYFGLMNNSETPRGSLKAYRECDQSIDTPYYELVNSQATGWTMLPGIDGHIPDGNSFEDIVLRNDNFVAP